MNRKQLQRVVFVLLLLALAAVSMWTYRSMKRTTTDIPKNEVLLQITPEYKIISRKDLKIWPSGTSFDEGMLAYFYAALPDVTVNIRITVNGLDQSQLDGTLHSKVILQNVNDKSQVYWSYLLHTSPEQQFHLSEGNETAVNANSYLSQDIMLNVMDAEALASEIGNELLFLTGQLQLLVSSEVRLSGTVEGEYVEKQLMQTLPISLQQVSFQIPRPEDVALELSLTGPNTTGLTSLQLWRNALKANPLPITITIVLALLLIILIWLWYKPQSKAAIAHRRYKEWITEGSVDPNNKMKINIFDLEGLVDLAIDLDKRVIYDTKAGKYYVLTEDIVYIHDLKKNYKAGEQKQQLGTLLLKCGLLQPEQLEIGLYYQNKIGSRLGESLIALGFIDETTLYSTLAAQYHLDYYEADNLIEVLDQDKIHEIGINKLKAFMTVPLGSRADGQYVIACSEFIREGILSAIQENLNLTLHMIAVKPSTVNNTFEALKLQEKERLSHENKSYETSEKAIALEEVSLTTSEYEELMSSYYRGNLNLDLFLRYTGILSSELLSQSKEQNNSLSLLVNKNYLTTDYVNLLKGLHKAIHAMDFQARQEKQLPTLIQLLKHSNYLSEASFEWVQRETTIQALSPEDLLRRNYLVSSVSIENAIALIRTLERILSIHNL